MDPFVVMSLGRKTYKTKVIRHNLNPVYDEKLVFQIQRQETNYSMNFNVVDRDVGSGNDFIGSCDFPLERATSVAPEPDAKTGLYPLKEPSGLANESVAGEEKKRRFRLPLSRSSSSQSLKTMKSNLHKSTSQSSLSNGMSEAQHNPLTTTATTQSNGQDNLGVPNLNAVNDSTTQDDPDLKSYILSLKLKNQDKWEGKHLPMVHIKAKYLPYKALRQQFWRAMLRQYDADESGSMSKVELTTMLDSLGSTLHESTIDGFFKRFEDDNQGDEPALTFDQAVICLEDLLDSMEGREGAWQFKTARQSPMLPPMTRTKTAPESSDATAPSAANDRTNSPVVVPTISHEYHGEPGLEGETVDANDLADERGEEHVVEIRECPICHQPRLSKKSDADIITHIATCASQDWRQVNNIVMAGFVTSSQAQRKWYSKVITKVGYGGYKLGANSANILVQDRLTGQINEERMSVYVRLGIRLLYKGLKANNMERRRSMLYLVEFWERLLTSNSPQALAFHVFQTRP